jgi:hypothetical protein
MRAAPTVTVAAAGDFHIYSGDGNLTVTTFSGTLATTQTYRLELTVSGGGLTVGHGAMLVFVASSAGYFQASAEL